jgi:hypothetical protein
MAEAGCNKISITRKIFRNTEAHACSGMYDDKKNVSTIKFTRSYACQLKKEEGILIVVEAHMISEKIFCTIRNIQWRWLMQNFTTIGTDINKQRSIVAYSGYGNNNLNLIVKPWTHEN